MKKIAIIFLVLTFATTMAFAGAMEKNCGCGLGTMLFKGKDGLISQISAATTNGSFGNQTFGITTGTLECDKFETMAMKKKLNIFIADNMDHVASDIASGQGEFLEAIADLADVPTANRAALYSALQGNFDTIYPGDQVTHTQVVDTIANIIEQI